MTETTPPPKPNTSRVLNCLLGTKSSQAHTKRIADHLDLGISDSIPALPKKHRMSADNSSGSVEMHARGLYAAAFPLTVKEEGHIRQGIERGNLLSRIQKVTEKPERQRTVRKTNSIDNTEIAGGVETIRRDELGEILWDQQEDWEFVHLLPPVLLSAQYPDAEGWITYNHLKSSKGSLPPNSHPYHRASTQICIILVRYWSRMRLNNSFVVVL